MSKQVEQLKDAIDNILTADEVEERDGEYRVTTPSGGLIRVRQSDNGEWTWYFESGLTMPYAPRDPDGPHRVVAMALL